MKKIVIMSFACFALHLFTFPAISEGGNTALPTNYKNWHHVKSMVIKKGHPLFAPFGGIHHIYANNKAVKGYKDGKFPKGSIIVFDLYEAIENGNAIIGGKRKFIGVMEKKGGLSKTGGWIYEVFAGEDLKAKGVNGAKDCHGCHSDAADRDFVFSVKK